MIVGVRREELKNGKWFQVDYLILVINIYTEHVRKHLLVRYNILQ